MEFIKNEDFKYVRALGAFYMRMVGKALDVYQYLEPLLNDYRKLRGKNNVAMISASRGARIFNRWRSRERLVPACALPLGLAHLPQGNYRGNRRKRKDGPTDLTNTHARPPCFPVSLNCKP